MSPVKRAGLVANLALTRFGIDPDLAGILFTTKDDMSHGVFVIEHALFVISSRVPRVPSHSERRHHIHPFELDTVSFIVEVVEFGNGGGKNPSTRRVDLFCPLGMDDHGRVKVEILANVGVLSGEGGPR